MTCVKPYLKAIFVLLSDLFLANTLIAHDLNRDEPQQISNQKSTLGPHVFDLLTLFDWFPFVVSVEDEGNKWLTELSSSMMTRVKRFNDLPWLLKHTSLWSQDLLFRAFELNVLPSEYLALLWMDETKRLIFERSLYQQNARQFIKRVFFGAREPSYLERISQLLRQRVRLKSFEKEHALQTSQDWRRHGYCVLLTMLGYSLAAAWTASEAARKATNSKSRRAAEAADQKSALGGSKKVVWNVLSAFIWDYRIQPARDAAWDTSLCISTEAENSDVWGALSEASWDARRNGASSKELGCLAYRVAEKASLLYFLSNFSILFDTLYQAALHEMVNRLPGFQIFKSKNSWLEFKDKYFGKIRPGSKHYFGSWLDELDWIASNIRSEG